MGTPNYSRTASAQTAGERAAPRTALRAQDPGQVVTNPVVTNPNPRNEMGFNSLKVSLGGQN